MRAGEAVDLINSAIFRPGFKLSASMAGGYSYLRSFDSNRVSVFLQMDTVNTSYPDADGEYRQRLRQPYPSEILSVDVTDMTGNELLRKVLDTIHEQVDMHEDREFLRVRQPDGTWHAPFHPHRADGDAAWYESGLAGRYRSAYERARR
jgi:hypothetical protein